MKIDVVAMEEVTLGARRTVSRNGLLGDEGVRPIHKVIELRIEGDFLQ